MSKRPAIDLMALTADEATTMPEAFQRTAPSQPAPTASRAAPAAPTVAGERVRTENLEGLAFKVSPAFRKRFRQRAATADLKLNELLFEALDAWEEKQGLKN